MAKKWGGCQPRGQGTYKHKWDDSKASGLHNMKMGPSLPEVGG